MATGNNRTSVLVSSQVPGFVREEHETFVKFLEYYYKFLEQDGQQQYVAKNFMNYLDIDLISKDVLEDDLHGDAHKLREVDDYHNFLQKLYDNYITFLPDYLIADKTLILKHAKDFYRSAGSEKSIRFLMRALYNKEVEFYYPQVDILKASDGKWFVEKSLKVTDIQVNNVANGSAVTNFKNHRIYGAITNAYATVEQVDVYYDAGSLVTELKLSNISREFQDGEPIFTYYTEEGVDKLLTANLFSGIISFVQVISGGSGYQVGDVVNVQSATGSGAVVVVSKTTTGSLVSIGVSKAGAGFRTNDSIIVTGGGGSGGTANVLSVNTNEAYHPNSYNIISTIIGLEANTLIGNAVYSNLASSLSDPANLWISNSMSAWTYANCGPVVQCLVLTPGGDYSVNPTLDISSNTRVRSLGILGRMEIVNGGLNYNAGDQIEFINPFGTQGCGGIGLVETVAANGKITSIKFGQMQGHMVGGAGYEQDKLPVANVVSATGNGANIQVTALIGDGETLVQSLSTIGTVTQLRIVSGGSGYKTIPTLDMTAIGDGKANAIASIVTGVYEYPGRYVNDDGHISSYNFLEDRDYYQKFSYVVKTSVAAEKFRKPLKEIIHPAGMRMFAEYPVVDDQSYNDGLNVAVSYSNTVSNTRYALTHYSVEDYNVASYNATIVPATYSPGHWVGSYTYNTANQAGLFSAQDANISIYIVGHGFSTNDYVYFSFIDNTTANIVNAVYVASNVNGNYINIANPYFVPDLKTGNVRVWNPYVTIYAPSHGQSVGNSVYLQFGTSDTSIHNTSYEVVQAPSTNTSLLRVLHTDPANSVSNVGTVDIYTNILSVNTAILNGFTVGDQAYIRFLDGDTANIKNGYYDVVGITNQNTFNVTANAVNVGGNTLTHLKSIYLTLPNHSAGAAGNVQLTFINGDMTNSVNGIYTTGYVSSSLFYVTADKPLVSNGNVRVYYSNGTPYPANSYSNVKFTTTSQHNLQLNDRLYVEFNTRGIANGIYKVKDVYSDFTFNIAFDGHQIVNTDLTLVNTGIHVTSGIVMDGTAMVAKYK